MMGILTRIFALLAWAITSALGVFLVAGLLGFMNHIQQDYSPVLYAAFLFLVCLLLARALSKRANDKRKDSADTKGDRPRR
jgi:hypothetical protein